MFTYLESLFLLHLINTIKTPPTMPSSKMNTEMDRIIDSVVIDWVIPLGTSVVISSTAENWVVPLGTSVVISSTAENWHNQELTQSVSMTSQRGQIPNPIWVAMS